MTARRPEEISTKLKSNTSWQNHYIKMNTLFLIIIIIIIINNIIIDLAL